MGNFTFQNKERSTLLHVCRVQLTRSSLVLIRRGKFWNKVAWLSGTHFRTTTSVFVSYDSRSKSTKGTRGQNCHGDRNFRDSVPLRVRQITAPSSVGACQYITHTLTGELSSQFSVLRMENLTFHHTTGKGYCFLLNLSLYSLITRHFYRQPIESSQTSSKSVLSLSQ